MTVNLQVLQITLHALSSSAIAGGFIFTAVQFRQAQKAQAVANFSKLLELQYQLRQTRVHHPSLAAVHQADVQDFHSDREIQEYFLLFESFAIQLSALGGQLVSSMVRLMDLPPTLSVRLAQRRFDAVTIGESGAAVWRCTRAGEGDWYLKSAPVVDEHGLRREAECMRWMRHAGLPTPAVLQYVRQGDVDFLLTEAAVGTPACDPRWFGAANRVASALGRGLARLHSADIRSCPFDRGIARQLTEARNRIAAGNVRNDAFDPARLGRDPTELFADLLQMVPTASDPVFVHGDCSLPNIFLTDDGADLRLTGFVDCARAGIGDRHQDLALAIRSLTYNFDETAIPSFLAAYGHAQIQPAALEFFTILDEFV